MSPNTIRVSAIMVQHWSMLMVMVVGAVPMMAAMADTDKEEMLTMGKCFNSFHLNASKCFIWEKASNDRFQYRSYSVGYPHGGPHITLHTTGNLGKDYSRNLIGDSFDRFWIIINKLWLFTTGGWGGEGAGAGAGAGLGVGHGHHGHDGKYVASNRGAIHVAPLVGHIQSVKSTNEQPAPGTTW